MVEERNQSKEKQKSKSFSVTMYINLQYNSELFISNHPACKGRNKQLIQY